MRRLVVRNANDQLHLFTVNLAQNRFNSDNLLTKEYASRRNQDAYSFRVADSIRVKASARGQKIVALLYLHWLQTGLELCTALLQ